MHSEANHLEAAYPLFDGHVDELAGVGTRRIDPVERIDGRRTARPSDDAVHRLRRRERIGPALFPFDGTFGENAPAGKPRLSERSGEFFRFRLAGIDVDVSVVASARERPRILAERVFLQRLSGLSGRGGGRGTERSGGADYEISTGHIHFATSFSNAAKRRRMYRQKISMPIAARQAATPCAPAPT